MALPLPAVQLVECGRSLDGIASDLVSEDRFWPEAPVLVES
jgi:hypothetical protein